jgi:hypothetical protein
LFLLLVGVVQVNGRVVFTSLAVFMGLLALTLSGAPTASADGPLQTTMATSGANGISLAVPSSVTFDGDQYLVMPITYTWALTNCTDLTINIYIPGRAKPDDPVMSIPGVRSDTGSIFICPRTMVPPEGSFTQSDLKIFDKMVGADSFQIEASVKPYGSSGEVAMPPLTVKVVKNQTRITKAVVSGSYLEGTAMASTSRGMVVARGTVNVQVRGSKSKAWRSAGSTTFENGKFSVLLSSPLKKLDEVRVNLTECGWCSDASKSFKVKL